MVAGSPNRSIVLRIFFSLCLNQHHLFFKKILDMPRITIAVGDWIIRFVRRNKSHRDRHHIGRRAQDDRFSHHNIKTAILLQKNGSFYYSLGREWCLYILHNHPDTEEPHKKRASFKLYEFCYLSCYYLEDSVCVSFGEHFVILPLG